MVGSCVWTTTQAARSRTTLRFDPIFIAAASYWAFFFVCSSLFCCCPKDEPRTLSEGARTGKYALVPVSGVTMSPCVASFADLSRWITCSPAGFKSRT